QAAQQARHGEAAQAPVFPEGPPEERRERDREQGVPAELLPRDAPVPGELDRAGDEVEETEPQEPLAGWGAASHSSPFRLQGCLRVRSPSRAPRIKTAES